jgi:molecular chaperone IbpA
MTSIDFGRFRPITIGFDKIFEDMEKLSNIHTNFPPYNIIKLNDDEFEIELAVAGFTKEEINIQFKDSILTIAGEKDTRADVEFSHKGISERNFMKSWTLGDYVKVGDAKMKDGLLIISLFKDVPEEEKPQIISIS